MATCTRLLPYLVLLFAAPGFGQGILQPEPLPGNLRDAGIYHLATGTWTRTAGAVAQLGPDVIYKNDALSGYWSTLNNTSATGDWSRIDAGRVLTVGGSVSGATQTNYMVNGLQFSYCTDVVGPNVGITFQLYDSYTPCDLLITGPLGSTHLAGTLQAAGLPGGTAGLACWIVTLDASGGGEFCFEGDGGPVNPGEDMDLALDAFGLDWVFNGVAGTNTGPVLAGDPSWAVSVAGALLWGGGGTYYHPASTCGDTGLDVRDFMTLDGFSSGIGAGCYFFGGYKNTNGCGGPANRPLAAFHSVIFAELGLQPDCNMGAVFCQPAGVNSSGKPVVLIPGPSATAGSGLHLNAFDGPAGQAGYFLVSGYASGGMRQTPLAATEARGCAFSGERSRGIAHAPQRGHQLIDLAGRLCCHPDEHVNQVRHEFDTGSLARFDQREDRRRSFAACDAAHEEPVAPPYGNRPD